MHGQQRVYREISYNLPNLFTTVILQKREYFWVLKNDVTRAMKPVNICVYLLTYIIHIYLALMQQIP